jgi:ankyrin repeat protein
MELQLKQETNMETHAIQSNADTVRLLLDPGADIEARNQASETALYNASELGSEHKSENMVGLLLERGAGVEARGGRQRNALCAALLGGDEAVIRLLLANGAKIYGKTCIPENQSLETSQLSLTPRAESKTEAETALAGLHLASRNGNLELLQILIDEKIDLNFKFYDG